MIRRQVLAWAAAAMTAGFAASAIAQTITLHGASQFNDDHAFTKALVRFEELALNRWLRRKVGRKGAQVVDSAAPASDD